MKKIVLFFCACTLLSIFTGCSKKKSEQRTVRIGIQPSAAFIPLYITRYSGELEKALAKENVNVIWQDFESGPPMNESLAADLTDIGVIGDVPTVVALNNSTPMKLVGIPARGPNAYALLASYDDSSINTFRDLKGKRIATVFGSTGHNFTKKLLENNNLSFSDINFMNISASACEEILKTKMADAVVIWEPNVTRLVDKKVAKIIATGDKTNLRGTNGFVVREEFLSANKDIIATIIEHYTRASKNISSLNPSILSMLANVLKINEEQVISISQKYSYFSEITNDDLKSLQDTIKFLVSINNLPVEYNIEDKVEKSYFLK